MSIQTKRYCTRIALVFAILICSYIAEPSSGQQPSNSPVEQSTSGNQQRLQEEKLRQEIIKLTRVLS